RRMTRIKITAAEGLAIKGDLDAAERKLGRDLAKTQWLIGQTMSLDDAMAVAVSITAEPPVGEKNRGKDLPAAPGGLSPREREVLCLVARGLKDREVGDELGISVRTVTTMMTRVLQKLLGHHNRTSAAAYAVTHGLCDLTSGQR